MGWPFSGQNEESKGGSGEQDGQIDDGVFSPQMDDAPLEPVNAHQTSEKIVELQ